MLNKNIYILIFNICISTLICLNTLLPLHANPEDKSCISLFINYFTPVDSTLLNEIKTKGIFKIIPLEFRDIFEKALFNYFANKKNINIEIAHASHIQKHHFDYSLFQYDPSLFTNSLLSIKGQSPTPTTPDLSDLGYDKVSDFYVFTSAGGSWARGGGKTIKAKMPLNIENLLTEKTKEFFEVADKFFRASSVIDKLSLIPQIASNYTQEEFRSILDKSYFDILEKILRLYDERILQKPGENSEIDPIIISNEIAKLLVSEYDTTLLSKFCESIRELLSDTTEELIENLSQESQAINIIDLKIAYLSVLSRVTQAYIPLDFWTGPHSHTILKNYLDSFKDIHSSNSYKFKSYTDNNDTNAFIVESIYRYLQATERLSFSLMFGYSELIPSINYYKIDVPNKKVVWEDDGSSQKITPYMSSFFDYLSQTGRQQELQQLGVKYLLFNNLEVLGPINLEIHAFREILDKEPKYNSAFILVPKSDTYKGGFAVISNNSKKILVEECNVDESLREDYVFFNTNTSMFNLDTIQPSHTIGFERKGALIKVKGNLGDISYNNETAIIEGNTEENYFNFKGYQDYIDNGKNFLSYFTKWMNAMIEFDKKYNR